MTLPRFKANEADLSSGMTGAGALPNLLQRSIACDEFLRSRIFLLQERTVPSPRANVICEMISRSYPD